MKLALTDEILHGENCAFRGSGGISSENHSYGFRPAFLDTQTGAVYDSCHRDGRPAPFHMLDGLPREVVIERTPSGKVAVVKSSIIAGFIHHGYFYDREEAARRVTELRQLAGNSL